MARDDAAPRSPVRVPGSLPMVSDVSKQPWRGEWRCCTQCVPRAYEDFGTSGDPCRHQGLRWIDAESDTASVPQWPIRLRLTLNMRFPELNDPRGICRDVASLGRWGNGDVELVLESREQVPYVMGLVRQSLERQLGNGIDG